jgi:hypothetical protein
LDTLSLIALVALSCYWGSHRTQQEKAVCFYNFWDIFVVYVLLIAVVFNFHNYRLNFIVGYVVYNLAMSIAFNIRNPIDTLCIGVARNVMPLWLGAFFLMSICVKNIDGSGLGNFFGSLIKGHIVINNRKLYEALGGEEEVNAIYEEYMREKQTEQGQKESQVDYKVAEGEEAERKPYEILGIPDDATREQIRAAFKKKTLENHPDRTGGLDEEFKQLAEKRMKEINGAYDKLRKNI